MDISAIPAAGTDSVVVDAATNSGSMGWSNDSESIYFHSLNLTAYPSRIKQVDTSSLSVNTLLETSGNGFSFYHSEVY